VVTSLCHFRPSRGPVNRQLAWHGSANPGRAGAARIIDGVVTPTAQEDTMGQMKEFAGVYYREGALDPKTMQLVALAAMAAAGCTS
jgi:alkylhydroperoxidase/carboxymuconolactone decarboxylase family protein YurZ